MLKHDSFGVPYWGRSVKEEIVYRLSCLIADLPCYLPLTILVGGLFVASRL